MLSDYNQVIPSVTMLSDYNQVITSVTMLSDYNHATCEMLCIHLTQHDTFAYAARIPHAAIHEMLHGTVLYA